MECNLRKGPDLAAIDPVERIMVSLFNPRSQRWSEHFTLVSTSLVGKRQLAELLLRYCG
jgi:hypothetical protein